MEIAQLYKTTDDSQLPHILVIRETGLKYGR